MKTGAKNFDFTFLVRSIRFENFLLRLSHENVFIFFEIYYFV